MNQDLGLGVGIGNWDCKLGFQIRIGDSGLIWGLRLEIRMGNWDLGLDMGLGDWIWKLGIMIKDLGLG